MEIRKCVYNGPQFDFLDALNELDTWRKLIGQPRIDKRYRDVELLLRVAALRKNWPSYKKPMKKFLNGYLADLKRLRDGMKEDEIQATRLVLQNAFQYVLDQLGEKPFHLRGRLNYAAMDSTLIASILAQENSVDNLKERYTNLVNDNDYKDWITSDTSDEKVLTGRIIKAINFLAD